MLTVIEYQTVPLTCIHPLSCLQRVGRCHGWRPGGLDQALRRPDAAAGASLLSWIACSVSDVYTVVFAVSVVGAACIEVD